MSGQSQNDPRITSSLDPAYIKAAVRASWMGTHNGAEGDYQYWIEKASGAEQFSDGIWRIGWNRYWETRMFQNSGDPRDGDKPAQFQPGGSTPPPDGGGGGSSVGSAIDKALATLQAQITALAATVNTQATEIEALKGRPSGGNTTGIVDGAVIALKSHTEGRSYLTSEPSGEVNTAPPDRAFGAYQLFTIEVQQ